MMASSSSAQHGPLQKTAWMISSLAKKSCVPCCKGSPQLTKDEVHAKLAAQEGDEEHQSLEAQGWTLIEIQSDEQA